MRVRAVAAERSCGSIVIPSTCVCKLSEKLLLAAPKISAISTRSSVLFAVRLELGRQLASKPRLGRRQRSVCTAASVKLLLLQHEMLCYLACLCDKHYANVCANTDSQ